MIPRGVLCILHTAAETGRSIAGAQPQAWADPGDCGPHAAFNETYMLDSYAGPWCFCKDPTPVRGAARWACAYATQR
jgi:hypothetical protein